MNSTDTHRFYFAPNDNPLIPRRFAFRYQRTKMTVNFPLNLGDGVSGNRVRPVAGLNRCGPIGLCWNTSECGSCRFCNWHPTILVGLIVHFLNLLAGATVERGGKGRLVHGRILSFKISNLPRSEQWNSDRQLAKILATRRCATEDHNSASIADLFRQKHRLDDAFLADVGDRVGGDSREHASGFAGNYGEAHGQIVIEDLKALAFR